MRPRGVAVVVFAVVAAVAVGGLLAAGGLDERGDAGSELPDAMLEDFDGAETTLAAFAGDGPLVVNFYASWCPPCVGEMRDAFGPVDRARDDVAFLGVALQDDPDAALAVAEQTGVGYQLVQDRDGALFQALGLASMPATVYIDEAGEVQGRHNGALTRGQLEDQISEHLDEA